VEGTSVINEGDVAGRPDAARRTRPPGVWRDPAAHLVAAAEAPWYRMVTALNASIVECTASFYRSRAILPALMPITVGSVSSPTGLGSDSLPVQIELLGDRTYLADSMQFQLEFILRHGMTGAYYIMPTFRAEEVDRTHLNQFFHSEAEIRGGLDDVMALVEAYLHALTHDLLNTHTGDMIAEAVGTLDHLEQFLKKPTIPRITFEAARDSLGSRHFELKAPGVHCITRAGEQALIEAFGGAVWLTHPPHRSVPFYQKIDENGRALSADLLLGIGEIVGCGARHVGGDDVRRSLADHRVSETEYTWYVQMKDRYPLETAGFGLGLERYLLWVLGHDDIRDLHVMPRIPGQDTWV
jgi:aspartyl/asparaginyl-tRNA synthetase